MAIVDVFRWIRGYSVICIPGDDAGKLMTICAHNGILLWNGEHQKNVFYGRVFSKLLPNLLALAEQKNLFPRLIKNNGLPIFFHNYRKRLGLAAGIVIFLGGLALSQQFIWNVEIEGCKKIDAAYLIAVLDELGVHNGVRKRSIDQQYTAREVLIRVDELSWSVLNFHGTTAILRIRERTPPPPKIDTNVPANVVASEDGQIKRLQITDGKAVLKEGETVRKGEVIVSGVWQDQWGLTHFLRAGAKVYAHVPRALTVKIALVQERYHVTSIEKRKYLSLFDWQIPLFFYRERKGNYKLERFRETPMIFDMPLPFAIEQENALLYEQEQEEISQEIALKMAQRKLEILELQTFGKQNIISKTIFAVVENNILVLRGDYEMELDIAKQQDIFIKEYKTPDGKEKIPREGGY